MQQDRGETLAMIGWMLIIIGVLGIGIGIFAIDTSVEVDYGALASYGAPREVANLQGMQVQSNTLILSGLIFLAGVVLCGFASLVRAIQASPSLPSVPSMVAVAPKAAAEPAIPAADATSVSSTTTPAADYGSDVQVYMPVIAVTVLTVLALIAAYYMG